MFAQNLAFLKFTSHVVGIYYNIFNSDPREKVALHEQQVLDQRRAESAYFQYALLRVVAWYPENIWHNGPATT